MITRQCSSMPGMKILQSKEQTKNWYGLFCWQANHAGQIQVLENRCDKYFKHQGVLKLVQKT
jgi:hypothetical protein